MRRVPIDSLLPGMKVGHNIYNSRGETLISHNVVLNKRYIDSLKRLGIPALYIIDDSLPDFYIEDVITEKSRVEAIKLVRNILQGQGTAKSRLDNALMNGSRETISDIIEQLLDNPSLMVNMIDIRSIDDYLFGHSVNVCVLSLITGISLGYDRSSLMNLGMGSLMHDMGKTLIPNYILNKPGPLNEDEFSVIKKHSEYGYSILTNNDSYIKKLSALIALQHHERYNGEGYPKGLLGANIHEFSQIVGIADVFDAMTADRVYRKAHPPYEAFEMLAGSGNFYFDYRLVLAFLSNIAAYPSGTIVWLSSKEIAIVVETPKGFPLYPKVKIIYDAAGNKLPDPVDMDLSAQNEITVLKVIEYDKLEEMVAKQGKLIS
ncbi:HD-GYP domain-containing protein [Pelotomaculum propionicicum]|uniref:Cyclic di-GMP phosphodiesterase response regulator RpfG n=1 Tax=Pelotomaculum propionicicum TaxID=258475 RepID=A0A4Y7RXL6_9FIRM|nr:HD-GYP domain-containing protein [Pelotomaculum propionicicum]NLI13600.1 HD-GYP domain-containing protein [Peptococcaceae bacterium]TEB13486.1 Cyclic di-GMP phosphodiesterase response regulator RpfG [Pelotomaculum propionicicum]